VALTPSLRLEIRAVRTFLAAGLDRDPVIGRVPTPISMFHPDDGVLDGGNRDEQCRGVFAGGAVLILASPVGNQRCGPFV
jgi:hypothetical protein